MRLPANPSLTLPRILAVAAAFIASPGLRADPAFPAGQVEFFEKNIRPLLVEHCQECHGAKRQKNGLRLDSREAVLRGSDFNKVVAPGDPEASLLVKAVRHSAGVEPMPSRKPQLASNEIDALVQWIQMGMPWPQDAKAAAAPNWREHWAYQAVRKPALPEIPIPKSQPGGAGPIFPQSRDNPKGGAGGAGQITNPVDAFVAAKLGAAGLDFAPAADRAVLCRRLFLDLVGLPPTFDELQAFVADKTPDACRRLVDRLLDSPRHGERWARHWLDVARYSDTEGYRAGGVDIRFPYAYTYRDWIVAALNADMPYDRFIMMQLAADKFVAAPGPEPGTQNRDAQVGDLAALGFLTVNDSFLGDRSLQIDDRIDVVSRGLLGITIGCARCHDHKYDPIASKDYYALYSVFNSCEQPGELPVIGQPSAHAAAAEFQRKVAEVESKKQSFLLEVLDDVRKPERLGEYLVFAHTHRDEQGAAFSGAAGKAKMRDRIASRWREFLKRQAQITRPHPVMLAWTEFAKIPADQFAARAGEVVRRMAAPDSGGNAVIREEMTRHPEIKSLNDVALVYANVFLSCLAGTAPEDTDRKQVRLLLQDPASPMTAGPADVEKFFTRKDHEHMTKFANEIKRLELNEPGAPLRAMVLRDTPQPRDVRVFIRGNPARQGDPAPRGYPAFLGGQKFTSGSGRLELARAIASKENPLTARVIVNRVWQEHFGRPLVSQPSDLGVQTSKPEHADLLDWLAATLMENGWSLKALHRIIVMSRTWQQSSATTPEKELKDAENTLLSRFNRSRLDYESMRDSLLAAAGSLDAAKAGGRSTPLEAPDADSRRSVYLFVDRYDQPTVPAMFDFANPDRHSPQRFVTTVPQQALFLMNSPFLRGQAEKLVSQVAGGGGLVDTRTVTALYRRVLLREPPPEEMELALRFAREAQDLQTPAFLWRYGSGQVWKDEETGRVSVKDFAEFRHFLKRGINLTWAPGPKIPDAKWQYCFWGLTDGHPGSGDIAAMTQWTAPMDAEISISGVLERRSESGNGVRGWIVNGRTGTLLDAHVAPKSSASMMVARASVKKGDVLSFAVTSEDDSNNDGFVWNPVIERLAADGTRVVLTDSRRDFCGPDHWPVNRPRPQSALSQLAQVLLMSNEFQFVE